MTFTADTSALLYGVLFNGPSEDEKDLNPHSWGQRPGTHLHGCPCACVHSCGPAASRKFCCAQLLRIQLSSKMPRPVCYEHEYDEATPARDRRDAVPAPGQQSEHSTAVVRWSLTLLNSSNGAPTAGVTTQSLVPAYSSFSLDGQLRQNRTLIRQASRLHFTQPRPSLDSTQCNPRTVIQLKWEYFRAILASAVEALERGTTHGRLQVYVAADAYSLLTLLEPSSM